MVQLSNPRDLRSEAGAEGGSRGKGAVKIEIEDPLEEECGPLSKRLRPSGAFQQDLQQQWNTDTTASSSQHAQYNPLDEPSPLGLRLRKSPSLLELIQMKLTQSSAVTSDIVGNENIDLGKRDTKEANVGMTEKLKASNFPATFLRIGSWECSSRYEGDLVAKCYFAKHKLVWEVLDGGLKSKIEIQWSDITSLKASCPEDGPGTLDVVLSRQPLFFKETNPQPRKHTLWQATSDFTGGQASIHRRHFLKCAPELLAKHFDKLIQCDPRLYSLSQQPEIILESPYFEPRCSIFEEHEDGKASGFEHMRAERGPSLGFREGSSTCSAPSTSSKSDGRDLSGRTPESSRETPSPISVRAIVTPVLEESASFQAEQLKNPNDWDQFKVPGLHPSMSMSDLVNHIGNCISEKKSSGDPIFTGTSSMNKDMLEEITQYLLSDSQVVSASDEKSLMSRVNSLCCLLQSPTSAQNLQKLGDNCSDENVSNQNPGPSMEKKPVLELALGDTEARETKLPAAMPRNESFGDLLLHLPRIASLPQFLFNISEES